MSYSVMPDLEAACGRILRNAGVAGGRVYSSVPSRPQYPLAVVVRLGGLPAVKQRLDAPRIQVSVWGTSKSEARDIAELARRTLHESEGVTVSEDNAHITGVVDEMGMTWLPDQDTGMDRYIFALRVFGHTTT